jgi:hypothetical protein
MCSPGRSSGFESPKAVRLEALPLRDPLLRLHPSLTGLLQQHDGETGLRAGGSGRLRRLSTNGVDMDGLGNHSPGLCRREDVRAALRSNPDGPDQVRVKVARTSDPGPPAVAGMLVGYADLPDPGLKCVARNIGSSRGTAAWPGVDAM